jgi:hypothetical protein
MYAQPEVTPVPSAAMGAPWLATEVAPVGAGTRRGGRQRLVRPLPDPMAIQIRAIPAVAPPYDADGGPGLEQSEGSGGSEGVGEMEGPGADALAAAIVAALDRGGATAPGGPAAGTGQPGGTARPGQPTAGIEEPGRTARPGQPTAGIEEPGRTARPAHPAARTEEPSGTVTPVRSGPVRSEPVRSEPVWPSQFAQVLAETLAGSRPADQLLPWTTERARRHIRRLGPLLTGAQQPVVRRVVSSRPAPGVVEMSVVVSVGPKVRALAIRLEYERPCPPAPEQADRRDRWMCTAVEAA